MSAIWGLGIDETVSLNTIVLEHRQIAILRKHSLLIRIILCLPLSFLLACDLHAAQEAPTTHAWVKFEGGTNLPPLPFLTFAFNNNFLNNNLATYRYQVRVLAVQSGRGWKALSYFFIFSFFNNASSLVPVVNSKRHM